MSRSRAWCLIAFVGAVGAPWTLPDSASAQRALPLDALPFDGASVRSVRAPDRVELPVRITLGDEQGVRFLVDVWVTSCAREASALLDARRESLTTLGLVPRALGQARAFAPRAEGSVGLVAFALENVVVVVRAPEGEDTLPLATQLIAAIAASSPPPLAPSVTLPELQTTLVVPAPAQSVDFRVTCDGACASRRVGDAYHVTRTGPERVDLVLHSVDALLRARHVPVAAR